MSSKKTGLSMNRDIRQPILKNFFLSQAKSQENRYINSLTGQCKKDYLKTPFIHSSSNSSGESLNKSSSPSTPSNKTDWINTKVVNNSLSMSR